MKKVLLLMFLLLSKPSFAEYKVIMNAGNIKLPESAELKNSCKEILESNSGSLDGVYTINKGSEETDVYCDMSGGGWTLLDNFVNDETVNDKYGAAYGSSKIYNIDLLNQAGYTTYLNRFNMDAYYKESDYLQIYYSSSPVGYMERTLPDVGSEVKVRVANWYDGFTSVYINNNRVLYISENEGVKTYIGSFNGDDVLKIEENGIIWIDSIWIK